MKLLSPVSAPGRFRPALPRPAPARSLRRSAVLAGALVLWTGFAPAQVAYVVVDVIRNDPVVQAVGKLEDTISGKLTTQIQNQETQISRATELNRSIGDWANPGPEATPRLAAECVSLDHTEELRNGLTYDSHTATLGCFQTASGQAMTVAAADLADFAQMDQAGRQTRDALQALATATKASNQEVASTYEAMIQPGLSQQAYEKLRGKLQALALHLQGLQAQQRNAFSLLQGQAALTRNKQVRDREIAAEIQKANHTENVTALADLQFAELAWR